MVNSPIGVSVLKLSTRRSFHPKCFSTLLDDNCDFLISRGIDGNFTRSRLNGVMSMIRLGYHYVSWVDDDDELIPDIYSELLGVYNCIQKISLFSPFSTLLVVY